MKSFLSSVFLILTAVTAIKCALFKCPDPEVQQNFDITEFLGKWYIVQETTDLHPRICPSLTIKTIDNEEGSMNNFSISILLKERDILWNKAVFTGINGTLDHYEKARIKVEFLGPLKLLKMKQTYAVLETDYKTYAVVWGCNRFLGIPHQKVFILGRERTLSDETVHHVHVLLLSHNLSLRLDTTFQKDCEDM